MLLSNFYKPHCVMKCNARFVIGRLNLYSSCYGCNTLSITMVKHILIQFSSYAHPSMGFINHDTINIDKVRIFLQKPSINLYVVVYFTSQCDQKCNDLSINLYNLKNLCPFKEIHKLLKIHRQ